MGHVALIVVMDDEGCDTERSPTEGRRATLYRVDLDAAGSERHVHQVLQIHRRARTNGKGNQPSVPAEEEYDAATIREWARLRGLPVSARGRIPGEIRRQYDEDRADSGTIADAVNRAAEENGDEENVIEIRPLRRRRGTGA